MLSLRTHCSSTTTRPPQRLELGAQQQQLTQLTSRLNAAHSLLDAQQGALDQQARSLDKLSSLVADTNQLLRMQLGVRSSPAGVEEAVDSSSNSGNVTDSSGVVGRRSPHPGRDCGGSIYDALAEES